MNPEPNPLDVALLVTHVFDALGVRHTIGGSVASSLAGEPRSTRDIDILHVHAPEDILLQKLRWYRLGGEVSDRQWRDVLAIARTQGERLDREYLDGNAPVLAVADLVTRLLAEA